MGPSRQLASQLGPVHPAAREIARGMDLTADAAFITEQIMAIVFPDRQDDPGFRELMNRNAYDNLDAMWGIIAGRYELGVNPPEGAVEFNDAAAQIGVPLGQFERIYRVGAALVWTLWFRAAIAYAAEHEVELQLLLGGPSMIVHAFISTGRSPRCSSATRPRMRSRSAPGRSCSWRSSARSWKGPPR